MYDCADGRSACGLNNDEGDVAARVDARRGERRFDAASSNNQRAGSIESPTSRGEQMTQAVPDRVAELTAQESRFVFDSFDHADAWRLGTLMVERALRQDAPIIIDIRRPGVVLFRSALAGTTEENEAWLN